ncbi:Ribonuclease PH [compost metagenome]
MIYDENPKRARRLAETSGWLMATELRAIGVDFSFAPVLDLDYLEDSRCDTDMNVVMTGSGGVVEIQGTAEGAPFTRAAMTAMMDLAEQGIGALVAAQKAALKA